MLKYTPFVVLGLLAWVGSLAGCGGSSDAHSEGEHSHGNPLELVEALQPEQVDTPYTIVTTTGMVADLVRQVAGEHAEVVGLLNADVDPHLYSPKPSDVQAIREADLVIYNGLYLEGRMAEAFDGAIHRGVPAVAIAEMLPKEELLDPEDESGHPDPHVWMDIDLWSECVTYVAQVLSTYDPANATDYEANASAYMAELAGLQTYVTKVYATIPEAHRTLVTAHDAFGYLGRAYGLEIAAVAGISTESEPGGRDVLELVDQIVQAGVPAVFVESTIPPATIESVIEQAASRGFAVSLGGELFSDAMGEPGTYEGTYIGMIDHNATVITRALGGDAPARGWQGTLGE